MPSHATPRSSTVAAVTDSPIEAEISVTTTTYDTRSLTNAISGTARPGALVGLTIANRGYATNAAPDGTWTITSIFGLVQPSYEGTASQTYDGQTRKITFRLTSATASQAPEPPVVTTQNYPADGLYMTVSGTARPNALVSLAIGDQQFDARADENGKWSVSSITRPPAASVTGTTFQVVDGQVSATSSFTLRSEGAQVVTPATITTTTYSRADLFTTITGTGVPGALIGLTIGDKTYDATVAPDGTWSTSKVTSLVASSQVATVFQIFNGASSGRSAYTLHADVPVAPVDVASPVPRASPPAPSSPLSPSTQRRVSGRGRARTWAPRPGS
jgi:hypothetical protein